MAPLATWIRTRIIPAILTALGVTFLAVGLLSFTTPVDAVPVATPADSPVAVVPETPEPRITLPPISSSAPASASPTDAVIPSPVPPTPEPAATPGDRLATRVRIAGLKVDLPVIRPPSGFPPCNVAMYHLDRVLGQPGEGKSVYLYAHARTGMFLPLLTASKVSNGKKMIDMIVEVWTGDNRRFRYVITNVYRHQRFDKVFDRPFAAKSETLWLQTSEGVGTQPKLLLKAVPLSEDAASQAESHPKARAGRLLLGRYGTMAFAASPAASSSDVGKSPRRIVNAVAAASPLHRSPPWRSPGASLVGSRMNMKTTTRR